MAIDHRLIKALHVETLRRQDMHAEREPHVLFQASTFESLLESRCDGEVSFAEPVEHGDLGLGTFDAVDGEMIRVPPPLRDRRPPAGRACARGHSHEVEVQVDDSVDLHVELPLGVELTSPDATSDEALRRVEPQG